MSTVNAQSTRTLKNCRPAAPPAGNTVRVWHIHLRRTAVASSFFGAWFAYVIDYLSFAAVVGGITILDENVRNVWIQDFCINGSYHIIFPIMDLCFPPPASTHPAMCRQQQ